MLFLRRSRRSDISVEAAIVPAWKMTYMLTNKEVLMRIAIAEAKAQFAELLRRVEAGEEIELTRYGRPVARLVAAGPGACKPLIGALKGHIEIASDFDELPSAFSAALAAPIEPQA
jgi:prevent-host-death family protein